MRSGASSMSTSTPVARSNALILRPSLPMILPFTSQKESETASDMVSAFDRVGRGGELR